MKRFLGMLFILSLFGSAETAWALPVYSVNGFNCSRLGMTVTCKGPIPGGKDSLTATGHNLVYLTMDVYQNGFPTRYTYFSDTGCLVGYTFGTEGKPVSAVAVHRNGQKASFDIQNENYDQMIAYCERELPGSPRPVAGVGPSAPASSSTTSKPKAAPAPKATPAAK
jgi:hypothetical protein